MHAILPKKRSSTIKKTRRKQLVAKNPKRDARAQRAPPINLQRLTTLDSYKRIVAKICTEATAEPENGLESVAILFDMVDRKGGGTDELKEYVSRLALRSLVAVAVHLMPRISYELLVDDDEDSVEYAGQRKIAELKNEKGTKNSSNKSRKVVTSTSNLVATEQLISKRTAELRDRLVGHCQKHLLTDPMLIVPLVARLAAADVRPNVPLLKLCVECCNCNDEALVEECLKSLSEVLNQYSISDLDKVIKVIYKDTNVNLNVIRLVNSIPLAKRQHSFNIMGDNAKTSNTHVESILSHVIAFYLRILAQSSGDRLDECLIGLARFGALVNETLQTEILNRMKAIIQSATSLNPSTHVRVIQAAASLSRVLQAQSHWIVQELSRMVQNTAQFLCQGQVMHERKELQFSMPCHSWNVVRTIQMVTSQATCQGVSSELESLVHLVQGVLSLCLVCDTAISRALLREVSKVIDRVPTVEAVVDRDGMVFSVLSKRATSYWELALLTSHYDNNIVAASKALIHQGSGATLTHTKKNDTSRSVTGDIAGCGIDVHELILVPESDMFAQYEHVR
ncbi:hypothetical protein BBOV_II001590 [Babesia bovis T2Bo]|uniref:Nucleolar complex-associated protein 3 N-terminal domain-containing protein n=1 Tax=Babesia bovis TaxID=5865 RepID=A7AT55_BABBO|nr:hypothetical protein BBOV_II001590 [Babesia bovis T2Bo]EDO06116.1 hypothetical protein BBOV_II001590 [Babesia bovis T2Bo]|eukprot:XP_001609684.1 hypothetical protein [Babesia bovis T2Bo]